MIRRVALPIVLLALLVYPAIDSAQTQNLTLAKVATDMVETAQKFWNSLTPDQQKQAGFAMDDAERSNWHFTPGPWNGAGRKGLPWKAMTPAQRELSHALMKAGMSQMGYDKVIATALNEAGLGQIETAARNNRNVRDPDNYFISIFGKPDAKEAWGWRFEGHHAAFNFTVTGGQLAVGAPHFIGSNPAKIPEGRPKAGSRILAGEEDTGRALVKALNDEQRKIAIYTQEAPRDILTGEQPRPAPLPTVGIPVSQLNDEQKKMVWAIIKEYSGRLRPELMQQDITRIEQAGFDKLYFGWAGTTDVGGPHYYRVQGPTFLIEYDNTQNNNNHIHAVWRDAADDFGQDILKRHYAANPH